MTAGLYLYAAAAVAVCIWGNGTALVLLIAFGLTVALNPW